MLGPIFSVFTGLKNSAQRLQNSANNLANINTPGFKKSDVNSVELKSGGSRLNDVSKSNTQGSLIPTGNPLDLAIEGKGFFQVTNQNGGISFTRSGNFRLDAGGNIVDSSGNALAPQVNIPGQNTGISVGLGGAISAQIEGQAQAVAQIQLASFQNPSGLQAAGGNLLDQTASSGTPIVGNPGAGGLGNVRSGFLESSNVDITEEIVDQIVASAAFKANVNVIKTNDEMLGSILDIKS